MNTIFFDLFQKKYAKDINQNKIIDLCRNSIQVVTKSNSNFDQALELIYDAESVLLEISEESRISFKILILTTKSFLYINGNNTKLGMQLSKEALDLSEQTGQFTECRCRILSTMGLFAIRQSDWSLALQYFNEAYNAPENNCCNDEFKIMLLNNIAGIYNHLGDLETSTNIIDRILEHYEQKENWFLFCRASLNKGVILHKLGKSTDSLSTMYQAKTIYETRNLNNDEVLGLIYNNLLAVKLNHNPDETAVKELEEAWKLEKKYNKTFHYYALCANTIKSLVRRKKFTEARELFDNCIDSIDKSDMNYTTLLEVSIPIFKDQENWKKVAEMQEEIIAFNQKSFNQKIAEQQARFKVLYEYEQSEKEKEIYKKKNLELEELNSKLAEAYDEIYLQKNNLECLNEKLHNMVKTKDRMMSVIAHDVRNPFQTLLTTMESLNEYYDSFSDSEKKEYLRTGNIMLSKVINFFENLLEWARVQTDNLQMNTKEINLCNLIDEAVFLLEPNAKDKGIEINVECCSETFIYADKQMIQSVMRNLINNAIKFSIPGKAITITAAKNENHVNIRVIDQGIGIKNEDIEKLFNSDILFSTNGTDKERGFGLGLVLAREFIENHNGTLKCYSEPDKGTTMEISIPC